MVGVVYQFTFQFHFQFLSSSWMYPQVQCFSHLNTGQYQFKESTDTESPSNHCFFPGDELEGRVPLSVVFLWLSQVLGLCSLVPWCRTWREDCGTNFLSLGVQCISTVQKLIAKRLALKWQFEDLCFELHFFGARLTPFFCFELRAWSLPRKASIWNLPYTFPKKDGISPLWSISQCPMFFYNMVWFFLLVALCCPRLKPPQS